MSANNDLSTESGLASLGPGRTEAPPTLDPAAQRAQLALQKVLSGEALPDQVYLRGGFDEDRGNYSEYGPGDVNDPGATYSVDGFSITKDRAGNWLADTKLPGSTKHSINQTVLSPNGAVLADRERVNPKDEGLFKGLGDFAASSIENYGPLVLMALTGNPAFAAAAGGALIGAETAAAIGAQVGLTAAQVTSAVGAAAMSGAKTALTGGDVGDIATNALAAGVGSGVSSGLGGGTAGSIGGQAANSLIRGEGLDKTLTNAAGAILSNEVSAALGGGQLGSAAGAAASSLARGAEPGNVLNNVLGAAAGMGVQEATGSSAAGNMVRTFVNSGGDIQKTINSGIASAGKTGANKTPGKTESLFSKDGLFGSEGEDDTESNAAETSAGQDTEEDAANTTDDLVGVYGDGTTADEEATPANSDVTFDPVVVSGKREEDATDDADLNPVTKTEDTAGGTTDDLTGVYGDGTDPNKTLNPVVVTGKREEDVTDDADLNPVDKESGTTDDLTGVYGDGTDPNKTLNPVIISGKREEDVTDDADLNPVVSAVDSAIGSSRSDTVTLVTTGNISVSSVDTRVSSPSSDTVTLLPASPRAAPGYTTVTPKETPLANIEYVYDWSSIFGNPKKLKEQEEKKVYARGGAIDFNPPEYGSVDDLMNIFRK